MGMDKNSKDEIIIKIDFSALDTVSKLIDVLKSNNLEVRKIGQAEYSIKL